MSRTRVFLVTFLAAVVPLIPSPAVAGGWWTYVDLPGSQLGVGETIHADALVLFEKIEEAQAARAGGNYYAYLLTDLDWSMVLDAQNEEFSPDWWKPANVPRYKVGTVSFEAARGFGKGSNVLRATTRLDIPAVTPGAHALMLCDEGCRHPLGDVVPSKVTVVASASEARLARSIERVDFRVEVEAAELDDKLGQLRRRVARASDLDALVTEVDSLDDEVSQEIERLHTRLEGLAQRTKQESGWDEAIWLMLAVFAAGVAGTVGTVLLLRKRIFSTEERVVLQVRGHSEARPDDLVRMG
jgi:hypothetical protein